MIPIDAEFQKLKTRFINQRVPVIMGEYAASGRTEYDPAGNYRTSWDQCITKSAFQHGLVPIYWDSGSTANHASGPFTRTTGVQAFPATIAAVVNAALVSVCKHGDRRPESSGAFLLAGRLTAVHPFDKLDEIELMCGPQDG